MPLKRKKLPAKLPVKKRILHESVPQDCQDEMQLERAEEIIESRNADADADAAAADDDQDNETREDTGEELIARRKRVYNNFTEEQEEAIVQWLKENPILYSKGMCEYKNKEKKAAMWVEMAFKLDITGMYRYDIK